MKCPHCGNETSVFRIALLDLADGSKTVSEIADLLERDPKSVRTTLNLMKREGHNIQLKDGNRYNREDMVDRDEYVLGEIYNGTPRRVISEKLGVSTARVGQLKERALRRLRLHDREKYEEFLRFERNKNSLKPIEK